MGLLEKLGLAQKRSKGAPNIGKKKKKEQKEAQIKRNRYLRGAIFLGFLITVVAMLPESTFQPVASYTVGEPWRADDLTAPFTFSLLKTESELEEEKRTIRETTAPVFHHNHNVRISIEAKLDSLNRSIQPVLDSYLQWQQAKQDGETSAPNDSIRFHQEKSFAVAELSSEAWNTLTQNFVNIRLHGETQRQSVVNEIRNELDLLINELLNDGIIDKRKTEMESDEITIRNLRERTERTINITNTRDTAEAREYAQYHLSRQFLPDVASAALQLFNQAIRPNWIYNESDTEQLLEENLASISRTKGAVAQGQVIIRRGDIVTPQIDNKLRSLAQARATTASQTERWLRFSGDVIIIAITALVFLFYLFLYRRTIYENPAMFLLVFLTLLLICVTSALVYNYDVNSLIVPVAVAPIILTIIFDSRVGLMATVTLAIITALIHDNNFDYLVATVTACSLGIFSVRDIKKRSQFFFTTPGIVFITYLLVIGGFALARFSGWEKFMDDTFVIAINSVFILFTYPLILLFEKSFKITTDFTLLELGDTNLPLLKELMTKAPGSFHHSLQVANLAESAASAIGANSLLCRVGALYHDIGKMVKPSYFIENQTEGNEHDKLKAKMSALVIKAHVSDGVKIAKKNNLPQVVIDFIKTHHGTSLIRFFFDKAQKNPEKEAEVPEEDFRYDGPLPFTKEQGILLLADGVEAASRAMKDPTYNKLESLINRMVDDNISEGQLSNCPLTFRQIQIIKESFLSILVGVYHSRIEYPEEKKKKKDDQESESAEAPKPSENNNPQDEGRKQDNDHPEQKREQEAEQDQQQQKDE